MLHRPALKALTLGGLFMSGCVGYKVKPEKPASMPRAEAPVALKVGVRLKKTRFEWQGMGPMNTAYMESHRDRWMFKPMLAASDDVGGKFLRALQVNPNDFDANLQLGALRKRDQRNDEARLYLERAVRLRPKDPTARFGLAVAGDNVQGQHRVRLLQRGRGAELAAV